MRLVLSNAVLIAWIVGVPFAVSAQWVHYPAPGTPRTKDGKPNLTAPAPRNREGKPDLSGIWKSVGPQKSLARSSRDGQVGPNLLDYMPDGADIPMRPAAAALFKKRSESLGAGRPSERCLPHGIPDATILGNFKLVQMPGLTLILFEEFNHYRQIFTDGRPFPETLSPAWFGSSIGKWDGDTFVIDTKGFNDQSWLDDWGHPHTEALHTTERFHRLDFGHMEMQVTIDDSQAYAKPWTAMLNFALMPDTDLIEDICENEKDNRHAVGK